MLVSIIIPCYNSEKYIRETIDSVLNQTHKEIEIICVDNGSIDNTISIIEEFKNKYSNIKLYYENNKGANFARNTGLKNANGDAVQFLDSDDIIHPNKIEKQINKITEGFDIVVSDRTIFDETFSTKIEQVTFSEICENPLKTCITKIIITGNPLYKKETIIDIGGWNENLITAQDWEFHIRLALLEKKFSYVNGSYLSSRMHNESLSSDWIKVSNDGVKVLDLYQKNIMSKTAFNNNEVKSKIFQVYFASAIHSTHPLKYFDKLKTWELNKHYSTFLLGWNKILYHLIGLKNLIVLKNRLSKTKKYD